MRYLPLKKSQQKVRQKSQRRRQKSLSLAGAMSSSVVTADQCGKALANADSGASGNYLTLPHKHILREVKVSSPTERIVVAVANGTLIHSTHHGYLDVPGHGSMMAYIFPQLKGSLLSISELVNVGLHVTYCENFVTAFDMKENIILQGNRDIRTGLWMVDLQSFKRAPTQSQQTEMTTPSNISNKGDH